MERVRKCWHHKKEYSNLEMAHLKEVEVDTQKEDSAAFEEYKKEFLNMLK